MQQVTTCSAGCGCDGFTRWPCKQAETMQVVVICGRNDVLRRQLSSDAYSKGATKVHAFGFVKNMHEFMNACDAIITKAGALSLTLYILKSLDVFFAVAVPHCFVAVLQQSCRICLFSLSVHMSFQRA